MITLRRIAILAAGSAALALSACSGGGETNEAPIETNIVNVEETVTNVVVENVVDVTPVVTNATPEPAPRGEDFTDTEQTKDDADATGMTSRVDRSADDAPATEPAK